MMAALALGAFYAPLPLSWRPAVIPARIDRINTRVAGTDDLLLVKMSGTWPGMNQCLSISAQRNLSNTLSNSFKFKNTSLIPYGKFIN